MNKFNLLIGFLVIAAVQSASALASEPKLITDELVQNLSCEKLDAEKIYKSIKPDAFALRRRFIVKNFTDEAFQGQCWSLARSQRLNLLLGREDGTARIDARATEAMISASAIAPSAVGIRLPKYDTSSKAPSFQEILPEEIFPNAIKEHELTRKFVSSEAEKWLNSQKSVLNELGQFGLIYSDRLSQMMKRDIKKILELPWPRDLKTFAWPKEGRKAITKFIDAVRVGQTRLFLRKENLDYLYVEQPEGNLNWNLNRIIKLVRANKLPLINMRASKESQHVVVGHTFHMLNNTPGKEHYYIGVIDSNTPSDTTRAIEIKRVNGRITAIYGEKQDLFLVEESERATLDRALVRHYQLTCKSKK